MCCLLLLQRANLEIRAKAAEEALAAAEKRHGYEVERLGVRIAALEAALNSERSLAGRLQGQVTSEIARARALSEAGERARLAEKEAIAMAEATRKVNHHSPRVCIHLNFG